MITVKDARAMLPKVGDILVKTPTMHKCHGIGSAKRQSCVVDFVHERHLWYRVRFKNGFCEAFKVPEIYEGGGKS